MRMRLVRTSLYRQRQISQSDCEAGLTYTENPAHTAHTPTHTPTFLSERLGSSCTISVMAAFKWPAFQIYKGKVVYLECFLKVRESIGMLFYIKVIIMIRSQLFCHTKWGERVCFYFDRELRMALLSVLCMVSLQFSVVILSPDLLALRSLHRVLQGLT